MRPSKVASIAAGPTLYLWRRNWTQCCPRMLCWLGRRRSCRGGWMPSVTMRRWGGTGPSCGARWRSSGSSWSCCRRKTGGSGQVGDSRSLVVWPLLLRKWGSVAHWVNSTHWGLITCTNAGSRHCPCLAYMLCLKHWGGRHSWHRSLPSRQRLGGEQDLGQGGPNGRLSVLLSWLEHYAHLVCGGGSQPPRDRRPPDDKMAGMGTLWGLVWQTQPLADPGLFLIGPREWCMSCGCMSSHILSSFIWNMFVSNWGF